MAERDSRERVLHAGDYVACHGVSISINNSDQMTIAIGAPSSADLKFWNGASIVDLGGGSSSLFLNSLGHVAFSAGQLSLTPRVYRNGVTTDVWFPTQIPASFPTFLLGWGLLDSTGRDRFCSRWAFGLADRSARLRNTRSCSRRRCQCSP